MTARSIVVISALLASVFAGACATGAQWPGAADARPRQTMVGVTGTGRVTVAPDTALVQLGTELRGPSLADVSTDAARRMTAVLQRVKALGVADQDITTAAYAVEPLAPPRRSEDEPARVVGYRMVNIVQLRIRDLGAVGRIVDAAMAAGATTIRGVHFILDARDTAEAEARARAVRDAAARARQLADAAGVRLGELVTLIEGVPVRPFAERLATAADVPMAPGPVAPGQLEIVVTVTARYRLAR